MMCLIHAHTKWRGIPLRIAANDFGVCALFLGSKSETLMELAARFPKTRLKAGQFSEFDITLAHLENPGFPSPPIAPAGTPFQQEVWAALCQIPAGKTTDYAGLAATIGRPKAVRAVASACAANPIAILIPCHRVIRRDGSLSGFRWGVDIKARLLALER